MSAKRILVIEDEPDIREVAQMSLEVTQGWEVLTAGSGEEGIAKARSEQPDAVVLDVMMPEMDGPATLQRLREDEATRDIPVIFMTAKVQKADRERFAHLDIDGFIAKPFDPMAVGDQITSLLGWHE